MTEDAPKYEAKRKPKAKPVEGELGEHEIRHCHARWWDGSFIHSCPEKSLPGKRRCAVHAPDGSLLDAAGTPVVVS